MSGYLIAVLASFACGVLVVMQAPINARLGMLMGGPLWAAFCSFLVGTLALGLLLLLGRKPLPLDNFGQTPLWMWCGGLLGAAFVGTTIVAVPRLGAGLMVVLIIAGQMTSAIVLDHYGLLVPQVHAASLLRIAGAVLVLAGAWMIYKG